MRRGIRGAAVIGAILTATSANMVGFAGSSQAAVERCDTAKDGRLCVAHDPQGYQVRYERTDSRSGCDTFEFYLREGPEIVHASKGPFTICGRDPEPRTRTYVFQIGDKGCYVRARMVDLGTGVRYETERLC